MPENPEVKFAKIDSKLDSLLEKINHVNDALDRDYVTNDQLTIKLANYELMRKIIVWLVAVVGLQIIGLIFYIIQRVLLKGV